MGQRTNKLILISTQLLLTAGWVMSVVCIVTHQWCYLVVDTMYSHVHENFGLYIMCQDDRIQCMMRENILEFDRRPWPHHPLFSKGNYMNNYIAKIFPVPLTPPPSFKRGVPSSGKKLSHKISNLALNNNFKYTINFGRNSC